MSISESDKSALEAGISNDVSNEASNICFSASLPVCLPAKTSNAAKTRIPNVLSVAGTDPCGGAGIQTDIKSITACGGYALTAITSVVSQNTCRVANVFPLPREVVYSQLKSVTDDVPVDVVKIGMLGTADAIRAVSDWFSDTDFCAFNPLWKIDNSADYAVSAGFSAAASADVASADVASADSADSARLSLLSSSSSSSSSFSFSFSSPRVRPPVVYDPVMISSSGASLLDSEGESCVRDFLSAGFVDVITPNIPELAFLLNCQPARSLEELTEQALRLREKYSCGVYAKSGHFDETDPDRSDVFVFPVRPFCFSRSDSGFADSATSPCASSSSSSSSSGFTGSISSSHCSSSRRNSSYRNSFQQRSSHCRPVYISSSQRDLPQNDSLHNSSAHRNSSLLSSVHSESIALLPGVLIKTSNTHGTGCSLSSALATRICIDGDWLTASQSAKSWLSGAIETSDELDIGQGSGPLNHFWNMQYR